METVTGVRPNFVLNLKKPGDFTVNLTLEHDTKEDVSIPISIRLIVDRLTFSKYIHTASGGKTIRGADLMKSVLGGVGYTLRDIKLKDDAFGTVSGTRPNFTITLKKAGSFNATLTITKAGIHEDLTAEIEAVLPHLTFPKFTIRYKAALTKAEILAKVVGNSTGYSIREITLDSGASTYATATSAGLDIKKLGSFGATLVLTNPNYFEVSIPNAQFQIDRGAVPDDLDFTDLQKAYSSGGSFTTDEILAQINGTKAGYSIKAIENLSPPGIAQISGDKKSLQFTKVGNFTATIVLQSSERVDATMPGAKFEIVKGTYAGSLSFTRLKRDVLGGGSATITSTQLMSQIAGATGKGFTLKSVTLDDNAFATVSGAKSNLKLTLNKKGNFTATLVLEHPNYLDVTISNAQFEGILPVDKVGITSWKFAGIAATINGTQISVKLPPTDVTVLKATLELPEGATISPDPTQSHDYTNPVDFKVTAQDKTTTRTYTVTVSLENILSPHVREVGEILRLIVPP